MISHSGPALAPLSTSSAQRSYALSGTMEASTVATIAALGSCSLLIAAMANRHAMFGPDWQYDIAWSTCGLATASAFALLITWKASGIPYGMSNQRLAHANTKFSRLPMPRGSAVFERTLVYAPPALVSRSPTSVHFHGSSGRSSRTFRTSTVPLPAATDPMDDAMEDWKVVSKGSDRASKTDVAAMPFVAVPVADGDLDLSEVDAIWTETVGPGAAEADSFSFIRFWKGIDDLFEYEDENYSSTTTESPANVKSISFGAATPTPPTTTTSPTIPTPGGTLTGGELASDIDGWKPYWEAAATSSSGSPFVVVSKNEVMSMDFIADPLRDGEIEQYEVDELWETTVGATSEPADQASFARFWQAVEDLFEYTTLEESPITIHENDDEISSYLGTGVDVSKTIRPETGAAAAASASDAAPRDWALEQEETSALWRESVVTRCKDDWVEASRGMGSASKEAALALSTFADPIRSGELLSIEVEDIWLRTVGNNGKTADEVSFKLFWEAVDALFEYIGDDENFGDYDSATTSSSREMPDEEWQTNVNGESSNNEWAVLGDGMQSNWMQASGGMRTASKDAVLDLRSVKETIGKRVDPTETTATSSDAFEAIWANTVGPDANFVDEGGFARFWRSIEEMYSITNSDGKSRHEMDPFQGAGSNDAACEIARSELTSLLAGTTRAGLDLADGQCKRIEELCDIIVDSEAQSRMRGLIKPDDDRLAGEWELVYTSSSLFRFNEGFTGVAKTTPGGAQFVSLTQRVASQEISKGDVLRDVEYIETLAVGGSSEDGEIAPNGIDLIVKVQGNWEMRRRRDLLADTQEDKVVLDVTPKILSYGPVEVRGNRVEVGWKSMRVLNGSCLYCLEPADPSGVPAVGDIRIQHGAAGKKNIFVFRRKSLTA